MNIRGLTSIFTPLDIRAKKAERKLENTPDRDARPDEGHGEQKNPDRHMTDEELRAVVERIRALPGVRENNLIVRVAKDGGPVRIFVEEISGRVVRRIPENEL